MSSDACNASGTFQEFNLLGSDKWSFWLGEQPCGPSVATLAGISFDGFGTAASKPVMAASGVGAPQGFNIALSGVQNASCARATPGP